MDETERELYLNHLETADAWKKVRTEIPGVFVVKVPGPTRDPTARLMLELNPVDELGIPKKKKGLFISNLEMLLQFREMLINEELDGLFESLEQLNDEFKSA
jgi:hypothetical protein